MERRDNEIAETVVPLWIKNLIGVLIFLAPIKFGMTIGAGTPKIRQTFYEWLYSPFPQEMFIVGVFACLFLWFVSGVSRGILRIRYSIFELAILLFFASSVVSSLGAPNLYLSKIYLWHLASCVVLFFVVFNTIEDEDDFKRYLNFIVGSALFVVFYAIYQKYFLLERTSDLIAQGYEKDAVLAGLIQQRIQSGRVFSTFIYPNALAGYLFLCLPVFICAIKVSGKNRRWIWILSTAAAAYALYLTFYGEELVKNVSETFNRRLEIWQAGFNMIKDFPIKGVGTYNFAALYSKYKIDIAEEVQTAHNNFLQIFAEQGVVGFLAFCFLCLIVLSKGFATRGILKGVFFAIILFLIHNLVDFDWYVQGLAAMMWIFAGILLWGSGRYREKIFKCEFRSGKIIAALAAAVLFTVSVNGQFKNIAARYYLQLAVEAVNRKDFDKAGVLARKSMLYNRNNPAPYSLVAVAYAEGKEYLRAIDWLKDALLRNKYCSPYYYSVGAYYLNLIQITGDLSLMPYAGWAFKKAVEYYPQNPLCRFQLARFYEANGQNSLALKEYEYCLKLNATIESEYKIRGKLLQQLLLPVGNLDVAKKVQKSSESS